MGQNGREWVNVVIEKRRLNNCANELKVTHGFAVHHTGNGIGAVASELEQYSLKSVEEIGRDGRGHAARQRSSFAVTIALVVCRVSASVAHFNVIFAVGFA